MPEKDDFLGDDSFWDIDSLMPKGKNRAPLREATGAAKFGARTPENGERQSFPGRSDRSNEKEVAALTAEGRYAIGASKAGEEREGGASKAGEEREGGSGRTLPAFSKEPERTYESKEGPIRRTEIYAWPNRYTFFSNFRKNALTSRKLAAVEAPHVPFFSFMPQYHQLTSGMLKYYLYWRASFESGKVMKADFSYIQLYVYEIINLPDVIDPKEGAELLGRLWIAYRKEYPKIEKYLSEWMTDYCLIHNVRPGEETMREIAPRGRQFGSFKEFYLTNEESRMPDLLLSTYSYKDSKYRTPENAELFDRHIPAAMDRFFEVLGQRAQGSRLGESKVVRSSYDGAVCVSTEKKRIDVYYEPVSTGGSGGTYVTDAVKYCENCVRAHEGIRARLATPSLTQPMRQAIEEYFRQNLPSRQVEKRAEEADYMQKYEAESHGFSNAEAEEIERRSLAVAKRLGRIFEEEDFAPEMKAAPAEEEKAQTAPQKPAVQEGKKAENPARESAENARALAALKEGEQSFKKYAAELHVLPESLMDRVNEEAYERFGDAAIEETCGRFSLIEEYADEIEDWLNG